MDDRASSLARRAAARFLIAPMAALCLAVPVLAGDKPEEKDDAAKVARKLERARARAGQAKGEREALRHFQEEVEEYAELHATQLARLGSRTPADAQESLAAQKALARAVQAKRARARPGDIFRPEVQPFFRRLLAEQLKGPDTLDARKAAREGNPKHEPGAVQVVLRVNAEYPPGAPLSTVPPSVLLTLPALPAPLQYRFVGRDLILLDSVAGLIADFLPAAAPDLRDPATP
jgi:multidrug efflux pump subunit AcrA (membrane-fusion protein)